MNKKELAKNIKSTETEIQWYKPPVKIRLAMRKLAAQGFVFTGHGYGHGGEDWGMGLNLGKQGSPSFMNVSLYTTIKGNVLSEISLLVSGEKVVKANLEPKIAVFEAIKLKKKYEL